MSHKSFLQIIPWRPVTCFLLLFFIMALPVSAAPESEANNPERLFYRGNSFYEQGNYKEAAVCYRKLLVTGYESGPLYYNLGNASFKQGEKGWAVFYYEKAMRFMPQDADLKANLSYVLGRDTDYSNFRELLSNLAPAETLAVLSLVCLMLFLAILSLTLLGPEWLKRASAGGLRPWWSGLLVTAAAGLFLSLGITAVTFVTQAQPRAVVVKTGCIMRFEPNPDATICAQLPPGVKVGVLEQNRMVGKNHWFLVKRSDGKRGWVEKEYMSLL